MKSRKCFPSARVLLLPAVICAGLLLVPPAPWAADPAPQQLISLEANKTPLGEVLSQIETISGYSFSIDDQWKKVPVTVTLYEAPLDQGLKRVLTNLNSVIIYGSENQIQIVILGEAESSAADRQGARQPYQRPDYSRQQPVEAPEVEEPEPEESSEDAEVEQESPEAEPAGESGEQAEEPDKESESGSDTEKEEGKGEEQGQQPENPGVPNAEGAENTSG